MAGISVIFKAVDDISSKFEAMTGAGKKALDSFDKLESAADSSYGNIIDGADKASDAVEKASSSTDYWTDAIGNYNKDAMEAIYTTEELVDAGFKTEDALKSAADSADKAAKEIDELGNESEAAGRKTDEFGNKSKNAMSTLGQVIASAGVLYAIKQIGEEFMEASEAASEFTTSIAKLTTVANTEVLSADQLSSQISSLSRDMAQNVNDLADASYNAISAGVDTADAVSTVGTATELAVAGFTSTESSLSVLTTALNAYQMEATELTSVSDSLVTSQNLGVLTIDQLSSSIGRAISTASAYSVDLYNLESGYISLTKAGISVEESTTYISGMFNELGDSGSEVSKILQEETGKTFGQLMESGYTLADALGIVYDNVNRDSEALMNLWGSAEAGKASNAIVSQGLETFNSNLEQLQNSAGATAAAYETMTGTTEYATQRMQNSFENLKIAIGDDLNPTIAALQNGIANIVDGFTGLINEHPAISAAIVGVTVALGAAAIGVAAYTFATTMAIPAVTSFAIAVNAGIWPLVLIVGAIAAVTAGIVYFINKMDEAQDMSDNLTTSSRRMSDELEILKAEYEEAVEVYGRNSDEAYALKAQMDNLNDSFEESQKTIGDLQTELEGLNTSIEETYQTFDDAISSSGQLEYNSLALVSQLETLTQKASLTDAEMQLMGGIVDSLNESYEGLNLTIDATTGKMNFSINDLYEAVKEAADDSRKQAATDALIQAMQDYDSSKEGYLSTVEEASAAWSDYENEKGKWIEEHPVKAQIAVGAEMNWDSNLGDLYDEWEAQKDISEDFNKQMEENEEKIREYAEAAGYSAEETEELVEQMRNSESAAEDYASAADSIVTAEEAVADAISGSSDSLMALAEEYDAALVSAQESIEGQYSLWDSVSQIVAMTSDDISAALQSQADYWSAYSTNLDMLTEKSASIEGLRDVLTSVADGSEDSAAMLAGMAQMSDDELSNMVTQYSNLQSEQNNTAQSMADLQTDFSSALDTMQKDMETAVSNMNMEEEASAAAKATIDAYIQGIRLKTPEANSAIAGITMAKESTPGLTGYASGTESADPGLKLVGEEGPEIIDFSGGERVYTAAETSDILSGESRGSEFYVPPTASGDENSGSDDKTITLKIEGSGDMRVGSNMSKEDVVNVLMENVKDALMNIIHQEILEEGDLAYEF